MSPEPCPYAWLMLAGIGVSLFLWFRLAPGASTCAAPIANLPRTN